MPPFSFKTAPPGHTGLSYGLGKGRVWPQVVSSASGFSVLTIGWKFGLFASLCESEERRRNQEVGKSIC